MDGWMDGAEGESMIRRYIQRRLQLQFAFNCESTAVLLQFDCSSTALRPFDVTLR